MIRAFLSTWTVSNIEGGMRRVSNPIVDYINANNIDASCIMYYPDADQNGLPDKNRVLVFVHSDTLTSAQLENAKNLTGVSLMPPHPLNTVLGDLPLTTRQAMLNVVTSNGIPTDGITLQSTYKDTLNKIITYFIPAFPGVLNIKDEFN